MLLRPDLSTRIADAILRNSRKLVYGAQKPGSRDVASSYRYSHSNGNACWRGAGVLRFQTGANMPGMFGIFGSWSRLGPGIGSVVLIDSEICMVDLPG